MLADISHLPLITWLLLSVLLGILAIWVLRAPRVVALATASTSMIISLLILVGFDQSNTEFQFIDRHTWIPSLNIHYLVGVDGLSVLFLPLTCLLFIAIVGASWKNIRTMPKAYYSLLLLLQAATLGIFTAIDTVLFMLFWELTLIPIYFLIALWGKGPNRRYAATKYTLLMVVGGIPLLFGFILLALGTPDGSYVFDYRTLVKNPLSETQQNIVFFLLFIGFAFKAPLFPVHTWLPVVAMEGPVAIGAIMTGLKLGAYGLIRFTIPLAPDAALHFHWLFAALGVIGIIYGALMAMQQTNLRRMLAYSSISHIGLVILALASMDIQGLQGADFQLLNFIFISGGLFLIVGFLYVRTASTELISLGGIANKMPLLTTFFFIFGIASIGIPGTSGFPAEFMMLISALKNHTGAGLAALFGIVLGAGYFLTMFRRAFLGGITNAVIAESSDLQRREILILVLLLILIFTAGLYPAMIMDFTEISAAEWTKTLKP